MGAVSSIIGMVLWEELERLSRWQRENLPMTDTCQGMALLVWLLKNGGEGRPIGQLYLESRNSEPTMRDCVKAFVAQGLAVTEPNETDTRQRLLRGTVKLQQKVREYRELLRRVTEEA